MPLPEITHFPFPADYPALNDAMEDRVAGIIAGDAGEALWFAEFPPLFTAGTGADKTTDVLNAAGFPVYDAGRGGKITYHGPGQRVVYAMLNLDARGMKDVRRYVFLLEEWLITALRELGVRGERREGRVGIWRAAPDGHEAKIAAIGIRIRKWVTFHGIALNVCPDLSHYRHIIPCGIDPSRYGVTSLQADGKPADIRAVDAALTRAFAAVFGE